ncbi:MAG: truA [Rickettsiaceae bacterium]|jgi:tRNA pseudouridine38-40 synthase|nr:truA [Rickettsiaceae bacterium]
MPRYKITIEYVGTDFCGWQRQQTGQSIQALIENAIKKFSQEEVNVIGSGRTDAGVHALGQVAHFDLVKNCEPFTVMRAINHYLKPNLIAVQDCCIVDESFHARFSAKKRHYIYRLINREGKIVIDNNRAWQIRPPLDISNMRDASQYLIGEHDFTSFRTIHCQAKSPVKTIDNIELEKDGEEIKIFFSANSFLHHMVRNMTSALVYVGLNKLSPEDIKNILLAKDRSKAPPTAPAFGLYFTKVEY